MIFNESFLEQAWDDLLSREPDKISRRFASLDQDSRLTVRQHLQKMVSEEGWHPEQVLSAKSAIRVINKMDR